MSEGLANQIAASDPANSVWVVANAGSGKTYVLTSRIVRLLLAGARPAAILCLTFTKAAAAEMRARLGALLAKWSTCEEALLAGELRDRLGRQPDDAQMRDARTLFAPVIDAPGALRIQTIHAFCESLLKRFPVEARVPPHFSVADDGIGGELMDLARNQLLADAMDDAPLREALALVVGRADEGSFGQAMKSLLAGRRRLRLLLGADGSKLAEGIAAIFAEFGVAEGETQTQALAAHFQSLDRPAFAGAVAALAAGTVNDAKRAAFLQKALAASTPGEAYGEWRRAFLTAEGASAKNLVTKGTAAKHPQIESLLRAEQARIEPLDARLNAILGASGSAALLRLGHALLQRYDRLKQARALLDYDDLILRAVALLQGAAPWVLYKLDGGIDHVLVDEAQDTAPEQWQAVAAIVDEFFAGVGARETAPLRSVFVVGDEKQSIFSFQGADLDAFERTRLHLAAKARAAWKEVPLELSFRSSQAVLDLVDRTFASDAMRAGVLSAGKPMRHRANRLGAGGRVELWAPVVREKPGDPVAWDVPVDYVSAEHPSVLLAQRIAATVKGWIGTEFLPARNRAVQAGDVLVLVRHRDRFFEACVRAFKDAGVAVAGADRMRLLEQIAIMDLLSLARFCLLPSDDLSLAEILKSPLYEFDDADLFDLGHQRGDRLWLALRARAAARPKWQHAYDELSALLALADYVPPYEFYAALLHARDGRRRLLMRLGPDAADAIDEFLAACLGFERHEAPSLQGFVRWFEAGATDIKRDMEQGRDEVRVMTVHGAKGLEAEIVFLPDTCALPDPKDRVVWRTAAPQVPIWPPSGIKNLAPVEAARDALREQQMAEYRRLLYVAMTRARDRLYICGWTSSEPAQGSWYAAIDAAFGQDRAANEFELPDGGKAWRFETPHARVVEPDKAAPAVGAHLPMPAWARSQSAPAEPSPPRPLVPSRPDIQPAAASPLAGPAAAAFVRGKLVHRLLQSLPDLPPAAREAAARRLLGRAAYGLAPAQIDEIAAETLAALDDPRFAAAFAPGSLAEAPIVARIGARALAGRIDRLAIEPARVLVVDFKTNRPPPTRAEDTDPAYLAQLAAYRAALRPLFAGRAIVCALLWTYAPRLMAIDDALLDRYAP